MHCGTWYKASCYRDILPLNLVKLKEYSSEGGDMHPYFRFYYRKLVAGLVIVGVLVFVRAVMGAVKFVVRFLRN